MSSVCTGFQQLVVCTLMKTYTGLVKNIKHSIRLNQSGVASLILWASPPESVAAVLDSVR